MGSRPLQPFHLHRPEGKYLQRIAVLAGGDSSERAISLKSGAEVVRALTTAGYTAIPIDPQVVNLRGLDWSAFDVVFVALHGSFGEDGQVQKILEDARIPFTGSGSVGSHWAFHKSLAKEQFLRAGLLTPPGYLVSSVSPPEERLALAEKLAWPLVVKPDDQGSSLGVTLCHDFETLRSGFRLAFEYSRSVLVEEAILGPEWTVSVLGDEVLPPIQIECAGQLFDFESKYENDSTQYHLGTRGSVTTASQPAAPDSLQHVARRACQAVSSRGLARVDLRLDRAGNVYVLEVNTVPGMTDHSLAPKAAAAAGYSFTQLCERMLALALEHAANAEVSTQLPVPRPHILQKRQQRNPLG